MEPSDIEKAGEKGQPPFFKKGSFFPLTQANEENLSGLIHWLIEKMTDLTLAMEKMNLAEYIHLLNRPGRLLYINFIAGVARGFGIAVGFALLGAVLVYLLQKLMVLNLPLVGDFIADIVEMVQAQIQNRRI